jgi:Cof subfamily protein (haloacid dehalogenase superfamily)
VTVTVTGIKLVISDVDGTLVTHDKRLTDASRAAVAALARQGIGFTITSSRPPRGLRMFVEPLALKLPMGAFNGGVVVDPDMRVKSQQFLSAPVAVRALAVLERHGVDPWLFTAEQWVIRTRAAARVAFEERTIQVEPVVTTDFTRYLAQLGKIVGVSDDFALLQRCEAAMQSALGQSASAVRSQNYYLDITPPGVDKGTFVDAMAQITGIDTSAIMTIGDMSNDIPMFRRDGPSVAMGNAPPEVKSAAHHVSLSNEEEGFATAIARYALAKKA